jgi:hypothetical protein
VALHLLYLEKRICTIKYDKAAAAFEKLIATGKYRLVKSTDLTPQQISAGLTPLEVFSKKLAKTD